MLYIVSYDIPDTPRRTRLSELLKDFGRRVHYSVFECLLADGELDEMLGRIADVVDGGEDSVRVYGVCASCERRLVIIGRGDRTVDEKHYIL
ncbi:MAG TPA: CRISPR-associated endonuclease Cas2 [Deltaproteobacteria bacterium]|nr:CRISPR-associated endonuclease Cas2 [Deltaproteobacteria bacterium]